MLLPPSFALIYSIFVFLEFYISIHEHDLEHKSFLQNPVTFFLYFLNNQLNIFSINSTNAFDEIALKERNLYKKRVTFDQDLIDSLEKEPKDFIKEYDNKAIAIIPKDSIIPYLALRHSIN